jgi:anti-anti-sigma regulatory factor
VPRPQPDVVELERCGVTQVVTLRGRHDATTMPAVGEALRQALTAPPVNGARLVMVDVGSVESCDGALAATLLSAHDDHCGDGDTVLVLAVRRRSASATGRLLVSSGACDVIPTFNCREAALAALEVAYLEALWAYSARRA